MTTTASRVIKRASRPELECVCCGYRWVPRCDSPAACPRCFRRDWRESSRRPSQRQGRVGVRPMRPHLDTADRNPTQGVPRVQAFRLGQEDIVEAEANQG